MHEFVNWYNMIANYFEYRYKEGNEHREALTCELCKIQEMYTELKVLLSQEKWINDEYRQEMLLCAEGLCLVAELEEKISGNNPKRLTNASEWLSRYQEKWLEKNKKSELYRIVEALSYCEEN